jgi:DNA-binding CsgD family transcriptional regulator
MAKRTESAALPPLGALYGQLLRSPGLEGAAVADLLGASAAGPDDLARLVDLGLIALDGDRVRALRPAEALTGLINAETERLATLVEKLATLQKLVPALAAELPAAEASTGTPVLIEVVGEQAVLPSLRSLASVSSGDLLWFRPDQWRLDSAPQVDELVAGWIRAGRRSQAIYPAAALEIAPAMVRARAESGEHVRVLADLPFRLAVVGTAGALVSESLGGVGDRLLLIRQRGLVDALTVTFELMWERAVAVPGLGGDPGARPLRDRLLLDQLAAGQKDEQIARALGVSLRTIRRRVAGLMAELGVGSRFQAGVEAVRRGMI